MKFTFTKRLGKIQAACSKDKRTPVLLHPYLDTELAELQATDSHIAVRVPVEVDGKDVTGSVDAAKIADGYRASRSQQPVHVDGRWPDLAKAWPTGKAVDKPGFRVGVDADLLARAAKALGTNKLELVFPNYNGEGPDPLRAILLRPAYTHSDGVTPRTDGPGVAAPEGLLMPFRLAPLTQPADDSAAIEKGLRKMQKDLKNAVKAKNGRPKGGAAAKSAIPYEGVPDNKLTAGQKAARTKALKAAGKAPTTAKASTRAQGGTSRRAAPRPVANGKKQSIWPESVLLERAAKAAATRAKNKRAAARAAKKAAKA